MPDIHITVKEKVATGDDSRIVCGNSDYMAVFSFDEEWAAYEIKTALFVYPKNDREPVKVVFEGNTCPVPVLHNTIGIRVGVFAGDLHTTTSAWFECDKSILCESGGPPADPPPDVYAQIMEKINHLEGATPEQVAAAVAEYLKENPVDPLPDGGQVGEVLTMTEEGAAWAPVTIPKEYGLVTYDQDRTITVS